VSVTTTLSFAALTLWRAPVPGRPAPAACAWCVGRPGPYSPPVCRAAWWRRRTRPPPAPGAGPERHWWTAGTDSPGCRNVPFNDPLRSNAATALCPAGRWEYSASPATAQFLREGGDFFAGSWFFAVEAVAGGRSNSRAIDVQLRQVKLS